jgi:Anti-sigma factor NepR
MFSGMTHRPKAGGKAGSASGPGNRNGAAPEPHDEIASKLRALYAEIEREPIPAELIDLLDRLDAAEEREKDGERP